MLRNSLAKLLALLLLASLPACTAKEEEDQGGGDESRLAELGQLIFDDRRLSEPQGVACASCHVKGLAFTGNNNSRIPAVAVGSLPNAFGTRNSPTAAYAQFIPSFGFQCVERGGQSVSIPVGGQFWDGRADDLVEQAKAPFLSPREMNNPSKRSVLNKIENGPYADLFLEVFGANAFQDTETAFHNVARAIAAAESTPTFAPFRSKFDAVLRGAERFTRLEAEGFAVFTNPEKGNCIACHQGVQGSRNPQDWLFTNNEYIALGVPRNNSIPDNRNPNFFDLGFCNGDNARSSLAPADFEPEDFCGAFKTPTLRNVAITGPYMHNGFFKSLEDVVAFYATRDTNPELWYPRNRSGEIEKFDDLPRKYRSNVVTALAPYDRGEGEEPRFTQSEGEALVAFLRTLTDR